MAGASPLVSPMKATCERSRPVHLGQPAERADFRERGRHDVDGVGRVVRAEVGVEVGHEPLDDGQERLTLAHDRAHDARLAPLPVVERDRLGVGDHLRQQEGTAGVEGGLHRGREGWVPGDPSVLQVEPSAAALEEGRRPEPERLRHGLDVGVRPARADAEARVTLVGLGAAAPRAEGLEAVEIKRDVRLAETAVDVGEEQADHGSAVGGERRQNARARGRRP